jgi:hypothetical protein
LKINSQVKLPCQINIYVGLRVGYTTEIVPKDTVVAKIQELAKKRRVCITVTDTQFVYPTGMEPGLIVGLMQYPRFYRTWEDLRNVARNLVEELLQCARQIRIGEVESFGNWMTVYEREEVTDNGEKENVETQPQEEVLA